ncbi:hypothetical protein IFM89_027766 [Coptis chinensis]|uniref:Uncharacterized protein n=1 Tax=Coptis chinensis TaxID=261450 RepID=A0A835M592_9MAGN|nr:hypothetical protein IFM89_027766 [Coptis chinensis]
MHGVPKVMWTDEGLGFIASKVGKPHCQDRPTKERRRLDYACVCVKYKRAANKNRDGTDARGFQNKGNNAIRRDFGIDRGNNTIMYDGNGPGEDTTRRIWVPRANIGNVQASKGAGTSCVRNEHGESSIPNDTGKAPVSGDEHSEGIQAGDAQQDTEEEENTGDQVAIYNGTSTAESSGSRFTILNGVDRLELGSELILFQDQPAVVDHPDGHSLACGGGIQ